MLAKLRRFHQGFDQADSKRTYLSQQFQKQYAARFNGKRDPAPAIIKTAVMQHEELENGSYLQNLSPREADSLLGFIVDIIEAGMASGKAGILEWPRLSLSKRREQKFLQEFEAGRGDERLLEKLFRSEKGIVRDGEHPHGDPLIGHADQIGTLYKRVIRCFLRQHGFPLTQAWVEQIANDQNHIPAKEMVFRHKLQVASWTPEWKFFDRVLNFLHEYIYIPRPRLDEEKCDPESLAKLFAPSLFDFQSPDSGERKRMQVGLAFVFKWWPELNGKPSQHRLTAQEGVAGLFSDTALAVYIQKSFGLPRKDAVELFWGFKASPYGNSLAQIQLRHHAARLHAQEQKTAQVKTELDVARYADYANKIGHATGR